MFISEAMMSLYVAPNTALLYEQSLRNCGKE